MNFFEQYQHEPDHLQPAKGHQAIFDEDLHFKTEEFPDSLLQYPNSQHQPTYPFNGGSTFSEQELAESLGWTYAAHQPVSSVNSHQRLHLAADVIAQNISPHNQPGSFRQSSSVPIANTSYGGVSIPQSNGSPAGWHSSLESPGFLAESASLARSSFGQAQNNGVGSSHRKEVPTVAEKKALRRYSHNAGKISAHSNVLIVKSSGVAETTSMNRFKSLQL